MQSLLDSEIRTVILKYAQMIVEIINAYNIVFIQKEVAKNFLKVGNSKENGCWKCVKYF